MARLNAFLAAAMLAAPALAHFRIEVPNSMVGENQNRQTSGPCGGFTPSDDDEAVDFHVGGDAVAVADGHSRSDWLIRGTLQTDASGGWKQLYDIYQTRGQGRSCQPSVKAPEEWIGERGIISVVGQAEDGTLYGCAVVNFVEGTGSENSDCRNASSIMSMAFVENDDLAALVSGSADASSSVSPSATPSGDADSDNGDDDSAATSLNGGAVAGLVASLAALVGGAAMVL